jgi:alpha(1,3/1,4) fucosyltransferase
LSKYKKIEAPGRSMNNMESIDVNNQGGIWDRKRNFLKDYKFTIALENYSYPGYNTEKLLDPMTVNSIPIYLGNPEIDRHFNSKSFVNGHDYLPTSHSFAIKLLESSCQPDFNDSRPSVYTNLGDRLKRKAKAIGRKTLTGLKFTSFDRLIEKIIAIDSDDRLYANYLSEPWFYQNLPPSQESVVKRWREIFGD